MAEIQLAAPPRRPQLIERIRARAGELAPSLRVIAEGVLGADANIDFVGVEATGRVVLIFVGDEADDLALIGRALAQRAWVEARVRDWIQLAPGLGLRPGAGVRALVLCPAFRPETEAAAAALGDAIVSLVRFRCVLNGGDLDLLFERSLAPERAPATPPPQSPSELPPFRTGLTHEDLGLSADEFGAFE